jgi:nucleotide-binding universal stress UspA family protein
MINFKKILFPVDLSAQSRAVAPSVAAMARRFGSEVTLVHVSSGNAPEPELDRFAAGDFSGIPIIRKLLQGDPARQLVSYADEHKVDLIMMPTHGHGPFRALLLGSVTTKVLRDTHCPVWTSVHAEDLSSHSPDRWKRILCAVEIDEHGESLLKWAVQFAQQQNLDLQLVHAVAGADGMWTEESDPSMYGFLFHAARERLTKLQASAGTNIEVRLMGGSVGSAARQAASEYGADLVVIGRGGSAIIRAAPCPVISI